MIVGAGLAGVNTVTALRASGFTGTVTLIGDETGFPYDRPPLSKQFLTDSAFDGAGLFTEQQRGAGDFVYLDRSKVQVVSAAEQTITLETGHTLTYDYLVLATGAAARPLNVPGGEHALLLRTADDAQRIRDALASPRTTAPHNDTTTLTEPLLGTDSATRVVVVGGGFIGLEVAASARTLGCQVTVLEAGPQLLTRGVPPVVSRYLRDAHERHGVDIRVGVGLEGIDRLEDGSFSVRVRGDRPFIADVVVAGVGAVPNVELAVAAGLAVDNGIVVDRTLRTSDPHIFAIGDCASFDHARFGRIRLEAWRSAVDHAIAVSRVICGLPLESTPVPWFWSDQYDVGLQVSGLPDRASSSVLRERADGAIVWFGFDDSGRLVSAAAVGTGTQVARDIRVSERLIAAGACPDPADLADPDVELRLLVKRMLAPTGVKP